MQDARRGARQEFFDRTQEFRLPEFAFGVSRLSGQKKEILSIMVSCQMGRDSPDAAGILDADARHARKTDADGDSRYTFETGQQFGDPFRRKVGSHGVGKNDEGIEIMLSDQAENDISRIVSDRTLVKDQGRAELSRFLRRSFPNGVLVRFVEMGRQ